MSTTFTRVPTVLVTNVQAVNSGTLPTAPADGDVFLVDRGFNEVSNTATVQTDPNVSTLYVQLGRNGLGGVDNSMPIQVRAIRNVTRSGYVAATPYSVTLTAATPANTTDYAVKIIYRDRFSTAPGHSAPRTYLFTSSAATSAAEIVAGLAARITADKYASVTATVVGTNLVIAGKVIAPGAIDTYQRVTFDLALPLGFSSADRTALTLPSATPGTNLGLNAGTEGQGIGQKVKDLEQSTKFDQRILFPIPTETTLASATGTYNLVIIEHYNEHIGDLQEQRKEPLKTVIAFACGGSNTPSAKETAFMTKLTSVVESAGVYVSNIS